MNMKQLCNAAGMPEDTRLRRNMKAFLLSGGAFRTGKGWLVEESFV